MQQINADQVRRVIQQRNPLSHYSKKTVTKTFENIKTTCTLTSILQYKNQENDEQKKVRHQGQNLN